MNIADLLGALAAAAVPTAIYSLIIWWLDRYEKEPLGLVLVAFCWGAVPAIALAVLFELVFTVPLNQSPLGPDAATWGLAPLVEEPLKALALAGLFVWARREFDGPLDGIVYGALIGFGFSMTENALYFANFGGDVGALFWLRSVAFGLNHAFFTSVVGLAFGAIRYRDGVGLKVLALIGGLALAVLFHALHNYFSSAFQATGLLFSWLVQSSGVVVVLAVAVLAWRNERSWMEQELGEEVRAGVISASEYADITSSAGRIHRQAQALGEGGWARYRDVRRLHHMATELAFCKSRVRLADRFQSCEEVERLRGEIVAVRERLERDRVAYEL